jgi:endoglucanase
VFKAVDPPYASQTLSHARQLYEFADKYRGLAGDSVPDLAAVYPASAYLDDLAWAAAWLYVASGEEIYLKQARGLLEESRRVEPGR